MIEGIPAEEQCLHGSREPIFGMGIYRKLIELADLDFQYLRAAHMLYEHKVLMTKRIRYLSDLGYINGMLFEDPFKEIELKANVIRNRNYILKNMINQGENFNTLRLISMIDDLSQTEMEHLEKFFRAIK
ncbi:hypothetical protein [Paenibacillus sp. P32E]|uniref:hypothetical protein n=1 Tax=Paenibacillus sp. P32E TaxID=1349434 RepID=UPI00093E5AB3|nr:hypothetical protein [Paenibacillus sp. P32E]OKP94746.1 hypothetical protein A3848_01875 [Paenibacillus sp. P32E]